MPSQAGEPLPEMASNPRSRPPRRTAHGSQLARTFSPPGCPRCFGRHGASPFWRRHGCCSEGPLGHKVVFRKSQRSRPMPTGTADSGVSPKPKPPRPLHACSGCRHLRHLRHLQRPRRQLQRSPHFPQRRSLASPAPPSSPPRTTEISLVRRAAVAANPASKWSAAEVGKLYVEQPLLNGKTFTRADIARQVEQFPQQLGHPDL